MLEELNSSIKNQENVSFSSVFVYLTRLPTSSDLPASERWCRLVQGYSTDLCNKHIQIFRKNSKYLSKNTRGKMQEKKRNSQGKQFTQLSYVTTQFSS